MGAGKTHIFINIFLFPGLHENIMGREKSASSEHGKGKICIQSTVNNEYGRADNA